MKNAKYRKISVVVIITICLFLSGCNFKKEFDKKTVQGFLNKIFKDDISKNYHIDEIIENLGIILKNPVVVLGEGSNRIGCKITGEIEAKLILRKKPFEIKRDFQFSTRIDYNPANHSLYLKDLSIGSDDVYYQYNLPIAEGHIIEKLKSKIREKIHELISEKINKIPVYEIKDNTFIEKLARKHLKVIEVKNGKLVITLKF